jgi:hypothetical protein
VRTCRRGWYGSRIACSPRRCWPCWRAKECTPLPSRAAAMTPLGLGPADGERARGNLACTSVPCPGAEWMSSGPPTITARPHVPSRLERKAKRKAGPGGEEATRQCLENLQEMLRQVYMARLHN